MRMVKYGGRYGKHMGEILRCAQDDKRRGIDVIDKKMGCISDKRIRLRLTKRR